MQNDNSRPSVGPEWALEMIDSFLDDSRVAALQPAQYRHWVKLVSVAIRHGGALPSIRKVAFEMRLSPKAAEKIVAHFMTIGLIEDVGGALLPMLGERSPRPNERASHAVAVAVVSPADGRRAPLSGAERTRRWRERRAGEAYDESTGGRDAAESVTCDVTVTSPEYIDSRKYINKLNNSRASDVTCDGGRDEGFARFWAIFPDRGNGENPKLPALWAWRKTVAAGATPETLIAAARAYASRVSGREKQFISSASKWLSGGRWRDAEALPPAVSAAVSEPMVWIAAGSPGWSAWSAHWRATKGKTPPMDARGGWRFPSPLPPAVAA